MPRKQEPIYIMFVRRVALGEGVNPSTYILTEKPYDLLRVGMAVRLYTRMQNDDTHLNWVRVVRARVVEKNEVEFVIRRLDDNEGEWQAEYHLLVAERRFTCFAWSLSNLWMRLVSFFCPAGGRKDVAKPIPRTIPPIRLRPISIAPSPSPILSSNSICTEARTATSEGVPATAEDDPVQEIEEPNGVVREGLSNGDVTIEREAEM